MSSKTPWTVTQGSGSKKFGGENYSFVANFATKRQADANASSQRRGKMKARIWKWKRDDGKVLYSVWIRRSKRFKF